MIFVVITNVYSIYVINHIENNYKTLTNNMFDINKISNDINLAAFYFDNYISTKTHSNLDYYNKYLFDARDKTNNMQRYMDEESRVYLKDLENIINSFSESANTTYNKFLLSGKYDEFYPDFLNTKKIAAYANDYVQLLNNSYLNYNNKIYKEMKKSTENSKYILISLQCIITIFCIIFAFLFSREITNPLSILVENSKKVSKGEFNIQCRENFNISEINILSRGFNAMIKDIEGLIQKIKEKADVEKKLQDEKMKNLMYENMLKEAQFKALQSQINPHFLFNTLNTVLQTAYMEEAYETEKLIESVSDILRYSLTMVDKISTLGHELETIRQYMYIQKRRFMDRVSFNLNIDKCCEHLEIPSMTLQPIVENAFIHGIEPKEEGGIISINAFKEEDSCVIEIIDNGEGMSKEKLNNILTGKSNYKGHTTGIGVQNVFKRLNLFYNNKSHFKVESQVKKGTKVTLKIPLYKEVTNV